MTQLPKRIFGGLAALCLGAGTALATPSITGTLVTTRLAGDANNDGIIDAKDLAIATTNLNTSGNYTKGDFDGNGLIDAEDLNLINQFLNYRAAPVFVGKILDTTTTVPGTASEKFMLFNAPVVDNSMNLAFLGMGSTRYGVYSYLGSSVAKVADNATVAPGGTVNFANFGEPAITAGKITLQGVNDSSVQGLFYHNGSTLSKLAITKPGGGSFSNFGDPSAAGSVTVFAASDGTSSGVYSMTGTTVTAVADSNTAIPSGTGNFTGFSLANTDGTSTFFIGQGIGQQGIYKKTGATLSVLLDRNSNVPGTTLKFTSIGSLSEDSGNVSFSGTFAGKQGVFAILGAGTPQKVADADTPIPDGNGAKFSRFGYSTIGGSSVAFVGYDNKNNPGIYAWVNGQIVRVIDSSMALGGKMISDLALSHEAVTGNKIAFLAEFADNTSGVYVASLLPTPTPGDFTFDGQSNSTDFLVIWRNLGKPGTRSSGDLNSDGLVTTADLQMFEKSYSQTGLTMLLGDADGDRKVDSADFKLAYANLGKYGSVAQGDVDLDGRITVSDLQMIEWRFGKTATAWTPFTGAQTGMADGLDLAVSVPEPSGLAALGLGAMAMLGRRRRS